MKMIQITEFHLSNIESHRIVLLLENSCSSQPLSQLVNAAVLL